MNNNEYIVTDICKIKLKPTAQDLNKMADSTCA